jgi:hypothetical protein
VHDADRDRERRPEMSVKYSAVAPISTKNPTKAAQETEILSSSQRVQRQPTNATEVSPSA